MRTDEEHQGWYDDLWRQLDRAVGEIRVSNDHIIQNLNNERVKHDFSSTLQKLLRIDLVRSLSRLFHGIIPFSLQDLSLEIIFAEAYAWMKKYGELPDGATAYARQRTRRYDSLYAASQHAQQGASSDSEEALIWATIGWLLHVNRPGADSEPVTAVSAARLSLVVAISPKYEAQAAADGLAEGPISKTVGTALLDGYMYIGAIETTDVSLEALRARPSADSSDAEGDRLVAVIELPDHLVLERQQKPNREFERAFASACDQGQVNARWVRASGDVLGTIPLVGQRGR
jgi:hypothetical protein